MNSLNCAPHNSINFDYLLQQQSLLQFPAVAAVAAMLLMMREWRPAAGKKKCGTTAAALWWVCLFNSDRSQKIELAVQLEIRYDLLEPKMKFIFLKVRTILSGGRANWRGPGAQHIMRPGRGHGCRGWMPVNWANIWDGDCYCCQKIEWYGRTYGQTLSNMQSTV